LVSSVGAALPKLLGVHDLRVRFDLPELMVTSDPPATSAPALRHVKLAPLDEVGNRAVRRLVESAIDGRRRALGV
jgi:hypothetical protein